MTDAGVIGRIVDVRSTTIRVALDVGSKGFTKVGPDGLQTVGVVNSYITVPAGAHRVVGIVSGVSISGRQGPNAQGRLLSQDDTASYELGVPAPPCPGASRHFWRGEEHFPSERRAIPPHRNVRGRHRASSSPGRQSLPRPPHCGCRLHWFRQVVHRRGRDRRPVRPRDSQRPRRHLRHQR